MAIINNNFVPDPDMGLYSASVLGRSPQEAEINSNGWMTKTWFPTYYSQTQQLDNWADAMYIGNVGAPFNIGNERSGWVYQSNLKWIYISPIISSGRPYHKPIYFWMDPRVSSVEDGFKGWYYIMKSYFVFNGVLQANNSRVPWFDNPPSDCTSEQGLFVFKYNSLTASWERRGLTIDSSGTVYMYNYESSIPNFPLYTFTELFN